MYKLLIVDDEYVEIEALTYIVKNSTLPIGEIMTANNGRQAIQLANETPPDMVLMDIKMPGITGIEAAAHIKDLYPNCKIVFLSAYNYFDYAQEAIRLEANDFLIKPVSGEKVIEVLNRLIMSTEEESKNLELSSDIENQFKQISTFFENELINYLLFADIKQQQLDEYFHALNCTPTHMYAVVVTIQDESISNLSALQSTMIKRRCIKTIKEQFHSVSDRCFGNHNKNWLYMVISTPTTLSRETTGTILASAKQKIKTNYLMDCRIAVSDVITNTLDINQALLSVKHELLFNQKEELLIYPVFANKTSNNFSPKKEQMLLESIELNNRTMILTISSEYCHWLKSSEFDTLEIKYILYGTLSHIVKSLSRLKENLIPQLEGLAFTYIRKLENNDNSDTLFSCFNDQLLNITDIFSQDSKDLETPIITKLCNYLNKNYMHDLSLKDLANDMNMNSQYISKHFKDTKGVTFSDYLTDVRMNKAKTMLTDTQNTIQEIGLSVGYKDPNYFTRAFKKHEAITPKQYRLKAYRSKNDFLN